MPPRKPLTVPAFFGPNEPPQLPFLSSQIQMVQRYVSPIAVSAAQELSTSKPPPPTVRAMTPGPPSAPVFRLGTVVRAATPQLPPAHSREVTFAATADNEQSEHSPAPSKSSLSSLETEIDSTKIPKPAGEAGRPGRGGYNLEEQLGWGETEFKQLKRFAHKLIKKYLDVTQSRSTQDLTAIRTVKQQMSKAYPMLDEFENCWPVDDLIMLRLKYTSQRSRQLRRMRADTPPSEDKTKKTK